MFKNSILIFFYKWQCRRKKEEVQEKLPIKERGKSTFTTHKFIITTEKKIQQQHGTNAYFSLCCLHLGY
jgi:hypothetical protein